MMPLSRHRYQSVLLPLLLLLPLLFLLLLLLVLHLLLKSTVFNLVQFPKHHL
jgi:uncharacterized BrkB/YihY/UPF0761 family membrane protein